MARWNKNIVVPLESLIKEKENTNRPTAARSAGTVGKWGKMGFTSTRTYALKAISATISPAQSPEAGEAPVLHTNDQPKPKKFFKSRNTSVDLRAQIIHHLPRAPPSPIREAAPHRKEPPLKIKIPKPTVERKKSTSSDRGSHKVDKKKKEKKLKPEAPPSRVTSRHRKVVNYAEDDDDRSQTPLRDIIVPKSFLETNKRIENEEYDESDENLDQHMDSDVDPEPEQEPEPELLAKLQPEPPQPSTESSPPAHKAPAIDHPPIVLRISKGTSRLISTDSEDVLNSPAYEAPMPEPALKSTADLLSILSEEPPVPEPLVEREDDQIETDLAQISISPNPEEASEVNCTAKVVEEPPKHESLKIVIKADVLKNVILSEKSERKSKSKKHHKNSAISIKIVDSQFKTPSPPPPGNDFDLYKALPPSPSERDFDSQSSVLGSISSKDTNQFAAVISDENCVIRSRGSSDVTSELESSQHSSLVAPPSDIESRLESMMDGDDDDQTGLSEANALSREDILPTIEEEPLKEDILDVLIGDIEEQKEEHQEKDEQKKVEPEKEELERDALEKEEQKEEDHEFPKEPLPPEPEQQTESEPTEEVKAASSRRVTRSRRGQPKVEVCKVEAAKVEAYKVEAAKVEAPKVEARKVEAPKVETRKIEASKIEAPEAIVEQPAKAGRITRSNNNGIVKNKPTTSMPVRSYSRKRKAQAIADNSETVADDFFKTKSSSHTKLDQVNFIDLPDAPTVTEEEEAADNDQPMDLETTEQEYKIKNKFKRTWYERSTRNSEVDQTQEPLTKKSCSDSENSLGVKSRPSKFVNNNNAESGSGDGADGDDEKRSVKLVITKKKGSIFKSRALVADQGDSKKRHVYKHTWDAEDKKEKLAFKEAESPPVASDTIFDDIEEMEGPSKLTKFTRQNPNKVDNETVTSVKCDKKAKEYYTVVRNVKTAHQIQEIGEYQEMDDDVEYILDALQPQNPISTRCLSALQLATKCMTPAFRMHIRAHGTVTKFFKALRDAKKDLSLGLCTATIMFVLSQDTLNMDLDRDSLELMMNLLESDASNIVDECGLANFERNKQKVKELCEEIKSQGKAAHLNIESMSVGTLAMETLLSLTSKRAGEWFKEELRELGGLDHIIKTICDCCHQISDYVVSWTEVLLDKLRTIERCLRVLENVSQQNEKNQDYILSYNKGDAVNTLFKLYKLCDSEIALYPTNDKTPKENPGVVLREALVPTLNVLINLTHPFDSRAVGSAIFGQRDGIFDTSFHILLQAPNYVPERCIFELSILVLLLLINLTMYTIPNRALILRSHAPSDFGNQFDKVPAIKALIEYFYRCEELARLAEQNTDAILENPEKKSKNQEELNETVTKLLQKAGHHMEHTLQASYAGILIGHLISDNEENERVIRTYLRDNTFNDIISILEKYYNFMNLTASSEAISVSHIKSTKKLIDYYKKCDEHSNIASKAEQNEEAAPSSSISTRSTHRVYKTYSQR